MGDAADQGVEERLFFLTQEMALHGALRGDILEAEADLTGLANPAGREAKQSPAARRHGDVKFIGPGAESSRVWRSSIAAKAGRSLSHTCAASAMVPP